MDINFRTPNVTTSKVTDPAKTRRYTSSLMEAVLLLIVVVLLYVFLVQPKSTQVRAQRSALAEAKVQEQSVEQETRALNELIVKMQNAKSEIDMVDQALPLDGRVTRLHVLLDNLVSTAGMKLASLNVDQMNEGIAAGDKTLLSGPYAAPRRLVTTGLTMTVTGSVEQFRGLLQLIETSPRIIDVDTIEMTSQQQGNVLYKLKLKAYSYLPAGPEPVMELP